MFRNYFTCPAPLYLNRNQSTQIPENERYLPVAGFYFFTETLGKLGNCCNGFWSCLWSVSHSWCNDETIGLSCPCGQVLALILHQFCGKSSFLPLPLSEGLSQMSVHYQKEMVFSHGHMFFGIPLCNSPENCLSLSEMVYAQNLNTGLVKGLRN